MVRLKTRWLLVRVDRDDANKMISAQEDSARHAAVAAADDDLGCSIDSNSNMKKVLLKRIQDSTVQNFGLAAHRAVIDTRGREKY
jgi:predicted nucleotidyltransferase